MPKYHMFPLVGKSVLLIHYPATIHNHTHTHTHTKPPLSYMAVRHFLSLFCNRPLCHDRTNRSPPHTLSHTEHRGWFYKTSLSHTSCGMHTATVISDICTSNAALTEQTNAIAHDINNSTIANPILCFVCVFFFLDLY